MLIGSVKSNMGHAEPASGLCSLTKIILSIHRGVIPPNLHYKEPNEYIEGLKDGSLKVIDEKTLFPGGIVGVNSFGFGGSNTHAILRAAEPTSKKDVKKAGFTRLFIYSGRTKEAVQNIFQNVIEHSDDPYLLQMLYLQVIILP